MFLSCSSGLCHSIVNKINDRRIRSQAILLDQQVLDLGLVGRRNDTRVAQVTFTLVSLFGQDVTVISVLTLDLSCAGERKTLLCSGICFHLWHFRKS